ncbi:MAG: NADH-quinone oxidoreductase subunit A [Armatimonadota bacterium]|nr:NADH-quinone oxidoreductase subunit A [Armatimonadota bacterium]MDR7402499.1 NADH-quinone oxidoreductase subunit A [Armatimonadota bacterium]MDR7403723.1 NADH-quinone oxidoreductase subunit A [Armatimonadota bacterium]MDR7436112.1 NADH-quinone oxidoreductase subunit A [Armatimonadota bacterium]MDR7471991.1 NADH-quinone oxidoreductase subunit A [Armatimonadota bacterium]
MADFVPIVVHIALVVLVVAGLVAFHHLVGRRRPVPGKLEPYESGVWPVGTARERVPIRYYLIAMLFLLLDVEAVFLYPWAVVARELRVLGLVEMLAFVGVLGAGFAYAWRRGALQWQ